jgi:hypothetical protein
MGAKRLLGRALGFKGYQTGTPCEWARTEAGLLLSSGENNPGGLTPKELARRSHHLT